MDDPSLLSKYYEIYLKSVLRECLWNNILEKDKRILRQIQYYII